jgi:hypothetical protein
MAGYFDPQYGWVNTGGKEEAMPLPSGLRRAVDTVFDPGDPRAEASSSAGQDPRFRFDPAERAVPQLTPPPGVVMAGPVASAAANTVAHEAGYRPDSFPAGDVRQGFSIDRSRGTSGLDWAASHTPGDTEVVRAPSTGPHTQGELEAMADARRMLDAAYGPTHEAFDPVAAQVAQLEGQSRLKVAQQREEDPVGFARQQAEIPEQAKTRAQLGGALQMASLFDGFAQKRAQIAQKHAQIKALPQYANLTPEGKAQADATMESELGAVDANENILKQVLEISSGHQHSRETPSFGQ